MRLPSKLIAAGTVALVAGAGVLGAGTGSAATGPPAAAAKVKCSSYRGDVKRLGDPAAKNIGNTARRSSVKSLLALPNPGLTDADSKRPRIAPVEQRIYRINVNLVSFKAEPDNDIHLIVAGPATGKRMIVEFVLPQCGKRRKTEMTNARNALFTACGFPGSEFSPRKGSATITGVGFYDQLHGQKMVDPGYNGIELHPVLSFQPTSACTVF